MDNIERLGARLRNLREDAGLTQTQLSKETGVSQNYISSLERGAVASPDPEILFNIGTKLGLEPNDIARIAGWWSPKKEPPVSDEARLAWERLMSLPPVEREPLLTILTRMVNATYREANAYASS